MILMQLKLQQYMFSSCVKASSRPFHKCKLPRVTFTFRMRDFTTQSMKTATMKADGDKPCSARYNPCMNSNSELALYSYCHLKLLV